MENHQDRRTCPRVIVGPDHTIRFRLAGLAFEGIRITNLSLTGCFAVVGTEDSAKLSQGAVLVDFFLDYPGLALGPFNGEVVYVLRDQDAPVPMEMSGVGIRFVGMDEASVCRLETFLAACLRP